MAHKTRPSANIKSDKCNISLVAFCRKEATFGSETYGSQHNNKKHLFFKKCFFLSERLTNYRTSFAILRVLSYSYALDKFKSILRRTIFIYIGSPSIPPSLWFNILHKCILALILDICTRLVYISWMSGRFVEKFYN